MQAYLDLLARGGVSLDGFFDAPYPVERAGEAYEALKGEGRKPLMVLLSYPNGDGAELRRRVDLATGVRGGKIRVALVGASSFAQGAHLPNMAKLGADYELRAVMSRTGSNAQAVAKNGGAAYCTTDYHDVLNDPEIDLVLIASRHDLHGPMALAALKAGKHTFVEKPLALTGEELDAIEEFYRQNLEGPMLMTGFNRRFAPAVTEIRKLLGGRSTPIIANYRMNAGYIPPEHWVHGPEGGGRNLGEACHIYDLFASLCGAPLTSVYGRAIAPMSTQWHKNDNFVAVLSFADGSVCTLTYTALGDKSYPKERMDIFADGKVIAMDDFKSVTIAGGRYKGWSASAPQKGQLQELEALADALVRGKAWPISVADQIQTSRVALEIERQIRQ